MISCIISIDIVQDTSSLATDTTALLVSTSTISIVLIILICIIVCAICVVITYKKLFKQSIPTNKRLSQTVKLSDVETNPSYATVSKNEAELLYMEVPQTKAYNPYKLNSMTKQFSDYM